MPRLRLAVAVLSALLAVGVADDGLAKPDGKSSLSGGFSSRTSSAPARERERDTSRPGADRSARSGKSADSHDAASAVRPARASRFGTFGNTDKEATAPSSPVSRRLTERTAQSNALRTLDARRTARVPPVAAPQNVPPSWRSSNGSAVAPSMRQGVPRNGAASIAPALPPLRGGPPEVSGAYSTQRTRHAVAAGAAAVGTGAALMATSGGAAQSTSVGILASTPAAASVPADNVAPTTGPNAEVEWFPALAFLALVLLLIALAGVIVHGIWRGIFPRRRAP